MSDDHVDDPEGFIADDLPEHEGLVDPAGLIEPTAHLSDPQRPPWQIWRPPAGTFREATKETVLFPWRLALGVFWLRAGIEHSVRSAWWTGREVRHFIVVQHDSALWFWRPVLDNLSGGNASVTVAILVVLAELWIGAAILFNIGSVKALRGGLFLNVTFVLSGAVNPSVFYILAEMTLLTAWTDRAVGRKPTRIRRLIAVQAIVWFAFAGLFVPFIRTVDPGELIGDPASTMSLVAAIMGATFARRWWITRND